MLYRSGLQNDDDVFVDDDVLQSPFDQCISGWADQVPADVNLTLMLYGTGCADTNPVAGDSPWCQTDDDGCDAATPAPTLDQCTNDPNFEGGNNKKNCNNFLDKDKGKKCGKNEFGAQNACPELCSPKKQLCSCNDANKVKIIKNGKTKKFDCKKIKQKDLCGANDKYGIPTKELCPNKCKNTEACLN